jgi:hypothetical protein
MDIFIRDKSPSNSAFRKNEDDSKSPSSPFKSNENNFRSPPFSP